MTGRDFNITDMNSSNGSFLTTAGGKTDRIPPGETVKVSKGEIIRVGSAELRIL